MEQREYTVHNWSVKVVLSEMLLRKGYQCIPVSTEPLKWSGGYIETIVYSGTKKQQGVAIFSFEDGVRYPLGKRLEYTSIQAVFVGMNKKQIETLESCIEESSIETTRMSASYEIGMMILSKKLNPS